MKLKKLITAALLAGLCLNLTACGDTSYIMKNDDMTVPTGVYVIYKIEAINAGMEHEDYNSEATSLDEITLDGYSYEYWVEMETIQDTMEFMWTVLEFEEQGLVLSDADEASIAYSTEYMWTYYGDYYSGMGVAESSYEAMIRMSYQYEMLFLAKYGADGTDPVEASEIEALWESDYTYAQVLAVAKDPDTLDDNNTEEQEAEDYYDRVLAGESIVDLINEQYLAADETFVADADEDYLELLHTDTASSYMADDVKSDIFTEMADNDVMMLEDDNYFYVVVRNNTSADDEEYADLEDDILYVMKGTEFEEEVAELAVVLEVEINSNTVSTFSTSSLLGL